MNSDSLADDVRRILSQLGEDPEREGGMEAMLMAMATGYDYRKYQKVKAVERRSR